MIKIPIFGNSQTVSDEVKNERLDICKGCEFSTGKVCSKNNQIISSIVIQSKQECPEKKWLVTENVEAQKTNLIVKGGCGGCANKKKDQPNMIEKIGNFIESVVDHAKDRFKNADETTIVQRMHTCIYCDQFENNWCKSCGCYLPEKVKWRSENCPLGKWLSEKDKNAE